MSAPEDALARLLLDHQRRWTFSPVDPPGWQVCTCGDMPAPDGPNSPRHIAHLAQLLAEYVAEREAQALREAAAEWDPRMFHGRDFLRRRADRLDPREDA